MSRLTGERTRPVVHRIQTAKSPPVDAERKHFADALTARIAAAKRRLTAGGMLRSVQWMRRTGEKDVRGRQAVSVTLLDAFIQERPGLDRSRIDTDRADTTVLTILDPRGDFGLAHVPVGRTASHVLGQKHRRRHPEREHRNEIRQRSHRNSLKRD